jgi:hypothetical protein
MSVSDDAVDIPDWDDPSRPEAEESQTEPGTWLGQLPLQLNIEVQVVPGATSRTRPAIRPRDRVLILLRDGCRCVICNSNRDLEVGHLISVAVGRKLGLSDEELFSYENLAAMCRECNRGLGPQCPPIPFLMGLLRARRRGDPNAG